MVDTQWITHTHTGLVHSPKDVCVNYNTHKPAETEEIQGLLSLLRLSIFS